MNESPTILCCGEALIDMLPRTSVETGEPAFSPYAGGAVFNTAITLGRLETPVGLVAGIASDFLGEVITNELAKSNVTQSHVIIQDKPSTVAFVRLVDGQASYAFYDENTAGRELELSQIPAIPDTVEAMFFGGISLISEPCGTTYETLMLREAQNRITMIDPNIRPGFIKDETAYRARLSKMMAAADIIKVSDEDLLWLYKGASIEEAAKAIIKNGTKLLAVTQGKDGATAFTAQHQVSVASQKVTVVDTVGAGDTFNGALLAYLHQHEVLNKSQLETLDPQNIKNALSYAAAAAAVTVSRAGANPPRRDELKL